METKSRSRWTLGLSLVLCLIWLGFAEVQGANAQSTAAASQSGRNFRLMTAAEGREIVSGALEQEQVASGAQDCSHVVHEFYVDAGFEYPYASSFEIYTGNENFARVKMPRAGDLIAWPGHVGIVVNPVKHSFYSLVSTGLETQYYDGPYWKSRGRPRFYRYKVVAAGILNARKTLPTQRNSNTTNQRRGAAVLEESSPVEMSERTANNYGPQIPETPDVPDATAEIPSSIIIATGNKQPTRDEIADGISELSNGAGRILRSDDPTRLQLPLVIFERFEVEKVEIKRDHGWAHLKVATRVLLAGGAVDSKRRNERVRWELRRTKSGWEAVLPTDRTYVPQDAAIRNLAAQLARLTESDGAAAHQETVLRQESQLANLLSGLLEKK
ncbi:MAG: hypothetical protein DMG44_00225 [Acidobacteria bacterium]|jgi:hypothetical protein|nr:MAG: hypothetical protein DMG44_00225 [Acidobacteriota bacterium]